MAAGMLLLRVFLPQKSFFTIVFLALPGLLIYLTLLILVKEFKIGDFKYILNLINPKNMKNYAVAEFKAGYQEDDAD